jgi:hypothetical protein
MPLWHSSPLRHPRSHSAHPFVEALEKRNLLSFLPPVSYAVGSAPSSVAVGDFDSDGTLDLAVANGDSVSILLGKGDGKFQPAKSYAAGSSPLSLAVGDFNGDNHLDLAVANFDSDTVTILLGNGDGTFQAPQSYPAGLSPSAVAVGDLNGDNHLDLAVANFYPDTVTVLLGNGDGSFQTAGNFPVGALPRSIAVGDFNGDGRLDLAVASPWTDTVSVLLSNGDATFQPAKSYAAGLTPVSVAVGDFDADGHLDLAVANYGDEFSNTPGSVSVLLGNGDGTFQTARDFPAGITPWCVAVADFDGNGFSDLAAANGYDGTVSVLLGQGDGTFQATQNYAVGKDSVSLAVGDFNGDGFPDLAVAVHPPFEPRGTVSILLNAADWGGPVPPPPGRPSLHRPVPSQPQFEAAATMLARLKSQPDPTLLTDVQPSLLQQWTVETGCGQRDRSETTSTIRRPMLTARHAQDAVFEAWCDGVQDALAWSGWLQRLLEQYGQRRMLIP